MLNRRRNTTQRILALEATIEQLSISSWFGCLTRPALDQAIATADLTGYWICFFDIDRLKQANKRWGKIESSRRIAEAIKTRDSDILALLGQWFSGDEFVCLLPAQDVLGYAQRTQTRLRRLEMSATFVLASVDYRGSAFATIDYCDKAAMAVKDRGYRNIIVRLQ